MLIDFFLISITIFFLVFLWIIYTRIFGAEFVKIPKQNMDIMIKMLKLNKKDIFYDVGCGTGEVLITVSPRVKQAVGIEIDPIRFLISKIRTRKKKNIKIIYGNLFKHPLNQATKLAVFLSPEANARLGGKLRQKSGKIIIASYKWLIPNLNLIKYDKKNRIYLHEIKT